MQACLYTTVVNTSGAERSFSFLGKHGKRLAADEQFSHPGNLVDQLAGHKRKFDALERALEDGDLGIMKTPAVHVYDETAAETQVLGADNGALDLEDPCWGTLTSVAE